MIAQWALIPVPYLLLIACMRFGWDFGSFLFLWAISIPCLLSVVIGAIALRANWPSRLIRLRLRQGDCGACGYYLGDLPPEMDGCTPCPECGAAWRVLG